ncbi:MAG: DUF4358 domain-containing protein [Clostridia bacterium]|nr:DUF4358 domain-containing protein [Clostridia bacterium]
MKKLSLICVLLSFILLCGCAEKTIPQDYTAKRVFVEISAVAESYENRTDYIKGVGDTLDTYNMSLWADGTYAECDEYALIDDYAISYSADNGTYEISVLKAKNADDTQKLAKVLERRKATLSAGDRAAYDPDFQKKMDDAEIITNGNFVILLITSENEKAVEAINNLKQ